MESKVSLKWSLFVIIFVGSLLLIIVSFFPNNNKKDDFIESNILLKETNFDIPIDFKIPIINIEAKIQEVGLTKEGAMDIPKNPLDVAWFSLGTRPGNIGSAVVAGHSGWKDNIPAVFDDLYKLKIGDKIFIKDRKGNKIIFIVRKIEMYNQNADTTDIFVSNDGLSHLNLITCEGIWDEKEKGRPNRIVVFTDRE
jgi:LPXTG-site transpeptidase (sortase) family protein